jgi:hypothetical protein
MQTLFAFRFYNMQKRSKEDQLIGRNASEPEVHLTSGSDHPTPWDPVTFLCEVELGRRSDG